MRTRLFCLGCTTLVLVACQPPAPPPAPPPPAVTVTQVSQIAVADIRERVGQISATEDVELEARVEGYLAERKFREGADVRRGELLFVIEQAPYRAELNGARAALASAQAQSTKAKANLKRIRELRTQRVATQADLEQAIADEATTAADILARQADVERAQINLSYTEIRAPIDGRIGEAFFSVGDRVGPQTGALARIVALDPVHVSWSVSEAVALTFRGRNIERSKQGLAPLKVAVRLEFADGVPYPHAGELDFIDNAINPATGTQTGRATVPNPDGLLLPGLYAKVFPQVGEPVQSLAIPQSAVQEDQVGRFVFVVNEQQLAERREVVMGAREGTFWVVNEGLNEGDQVIYQGIQKVRPGAPVNPTILAPKALSES